MKEVHQELEVTDMSNMQEHSQDSEGLIDSDFLAEAEGCFIASRKDEYDDACERDAPLECDLLMNSEAPVYRGTSRRDSLLMKAYEEKAEMDMLCNNFDKLEAKDECDDLFGAAIADLNEEITK